MSRLFTISLLVAVVAGFLSGLAFQRTAQGAVLWEFWFDIPTANNGETAEIRCYWHTFACGANSADVFLDWSTPGNANRTVYLRGGGYAPGQFWAVGSVGDTYLSPGWNGSPCYDIVVSDYYNAFNPTEWQMSMIYKHTWNPQSGQQLFYSDPIAPNGPSMVGTMTPSPGDPWGCSWSGPHVHSGDCACSPLAVARNTGTWPGWPEETGLPYPTYTNLNIWNQYFSWWH